MTTYPYLNNVGKIVPFFQHIQSAGVPNTVNQHYLASVGFRSSNDRPLITLAKYLKFLDSNNAPTPRWNRYKDRAASGALLAEAIREGYSTLFERYPDAYRKDDEALTNFFSVETGLGKRAVEATVKTFKTVCGLGDFAVQAEAPPSELITPPARTPSVAAARQSSAGMTININVQLQLPASDDPNVYDQLFAAMKKHLLSEQ